MKAARKRKVADDDTDTTITKKPKLTQTSVSPTMTVPQSTVDRLIQNFVIDYMEPLSVVEAPSFVELVKGLQPNRTVMSRKTLDGMLRICCIRP